jgi:dihydrofolate reductase
MAKLMYVNNMSLDGYMEDRHGVFDFGPMDDDVFAAYIALLRSVGTFLYGRRLYETMAPSGRPALPWPRSPP